GGRRPEDHLRLGRLHQHVGTRARRRRPRRGLRRGGRTGLHLRQGQADPRHRLRSRGRRQGALPDVGRGEEAQVEEVLPEQVRFQAQVEDRQRQELQVLVRNSAAALTVAVVSVVCALVLRALEPPVWATFALVAVLLAATLGGAAV